MYLSQYLVPSFSPFDSDDIDELISIAQSHFDGAFRSVVSQSLPAPLNGRLHSINGCTCTTEQRRHFQHVFVCARVLTKRSLQRLDIHVITFSRPINYQSKTEGLKQLSSAVHATTVQVSHSSNRLGKVCMMLRCFSTDYITDQSKHQVNCARATEKKNGRNAIFYAVCAVGLLPQ